MNTKTRRKKSTIRTSKRAERLKSGRPNTTSSDVKSMGTSKRLLRAGLNVLSLPGAESVMSDGLSKLADSIGFKKLESVFDQRVAAALERMGYPSASELQKLVNEFETLLQHRRKARARG